MKNYLLQGLFCVLFFILAASCSSSPGNGGGGNGSSSSNSASSSSSTSSSSSSSSSSKSSVSSVSYDFYVSTNGNDANSGTLSSPFRTITHAVQVAGPNKTIKVSPGTYSNGEIFPLILKTGQGLYGDPDNFGTGTIPTVITGTNTNFIEGWQSPLIFITNTAVISGFSMGLSTYLVCSMAIFVSNANATIISNTFNLESYAGIVVDYNNNSIIAFNKFSAIDCYCIFINDNTSGSPVISNNLFISSAFTIRIDAGTPVINNNAISGCVQCEMGTPLISNNYFTNSGISYGTINVWTGAPVIRCNVFVCPNNAIVIQHQTGNPESNPDIGTALYPGNNDFSRLTTNAVSMWSNTDTQIDAVGNTWLHNPPTSNDIYLDPFCTGRVIYDSAGDYIGQ